MAKKSGTLKKISGGGALGLANGLLGGGGGMIAVPLLQRAGLSVRKAHATAIAVILPASLLSGIIYCIKGFTPVSVLLPTALGVSFGGFLGAKLLGKLPARITAGSFALLMLASGLRMLF